MPLYREDWQTMATFPYCFFSFRDSPPMIPAMIIPFPICLFCPFRFPLCFCGPTSGRTGKTSSVGRCCAVLPDTARSTGFTIQKHTNGCGAIHASWAEWVERAVSGRTVAFVASCPLFCPTLPVLPIVAPKALVLGRWGTKGSTNKQWRQCWGGGLCPGDYTAERPPKLQ